MSPLRALEYTLSSAEGETNVEAGDNDTTGSGEAAPRCVAIDGPVASGKSAVGGRIARRLGYRFVDTGMMYRALTWLALQRGIDLHDEQALAKLAGDATMAVKLGPPEAPEAGRVHVDGTDATGHLRTTEVGEAVSLVSRVPAVRRAMVRIQRELAAEGDVVMAGRDIGTVVLPDAGLKVYLDASASERARRRHDELQASGRDETLADVESELELRDEIDSGRSASPLRPADDALVIDTDRLSLDAVVERIMKALPCC